MDLTECVYVFVCVRACVQRTKQLLFLYTVLARSSRKQTWQWRPVREVNNLGSGHDMQRMIYSVLFTRSRLPPLILPSLGQADF